MRMHTPQEMSRFCQSLVDAPHPCEQRVISAGRFAQFSPPILPKAAAPEVLLLCEVAFWYRGHCGCPLHPVLGGAPCCSLAPEQPCTDNCRVLLIRASHACVCLCQVSDKSLTAKEGGLTRTMKSSFSDLCIKYEDIRGVDRMAAVQASSMSRQKGTSFLEKTSTVYDV